MCGWFAAGAARAALASADVLPPQVPASSFLAAKPATEWLAGALSSVPSDRLSAADAAEGSSRGPSPRVKAMLLSLVLPGLGQYTAGHKSSGLFFFGTEAAIWASYAGFKLQGDSREERYQEFAERWGGVENAEGQSDTYYSDLGKYESFEDYRVIAVHSGEGELYADDQHWLWPSVERRRRYRDLLSQAENSDQNAEFMLSAALLNRAIAVVHAARSVSPTRPPKLSLHVEPDGALRPMLVWKTRF
jgi:hypothetical protein